jgi:hypothetical protein
MNPNTAAFVPGHPYQQSHGDVASINNFPDSNTAPYISSSDITPRVSEFPSMEALRTSLQTLSGAYQDTCSLADRSQITMMAQQLPGTPRETELVSRSSQRPDPSPLHRLSNLDLQDAPERSQVLAVYTQSVDKTTNPGYMPIGSLVNLKGPPKWGVVKISNVSGLVAQHGR